MSVADRVEQPATEDPRWTLGDRLYKSRKAAKLTGQEMAEGLTVLLGRHISKQTVSNWENDLNQPRKLFQVVEAWASLCPAEFTADWILRSRCSCSDPQVKAGGVCGRCHGWVMYAVPPSIAQELPFATEPAPLRLEPSLADTG